MERLSLFEQSTKGELLAEKMQSEAIVHSITDPLLVLDRHCRILLMNGAGEAFFGVTERNAAGHHFMECIRNEDLYAVLIACAESGGKTEKVVRLPLKEHSRFFNAVVVPLQSAGNAKYIFWLQDITDFKELERVKNEFIATISHELKTPLTSIVMGISMLDNGHMGGLTKDQCEVVSTISEYAQMMTELVGRMLELAQIESGKAVYRMAPCQIGRMIEDSCGLFRKEAGRKKIRFSVRAQEKLPAVYGDAEKLTWVLNNLLSNAFKYVPAGGTVTVSARAAGSCAEVSVTDDGEGIPPEFLDKVFDEYVRVPAKDVEVRGTGLGLYAARRILEEHRGGITVKSEMGKGSRFTFTVPFYWEGFE